MGRPEEGWHGLMRLRSGPRPIATRFTGRQPRRIRLEDVPDEAREALRLGIEALAEAGATAWVTYGTLLGLVREGRLLPHDHDVDIAVMPVADDAPIRAAMAARGLTLLLDEADSSGTSKLKFVHGPVVLDLFFIREEGGVWVDYCTLMKLSLLRNTHTHVAIEARVLDGLTLPVPRDAETYLAHLYGPGWRTPVTRWSWYLSPPNAEMIVHWAELPRLAEKVWRWKRGRRARA